MRLFFASLIIVVHYFDLRFTIYPNFTSVNSMSNIEYGLILGFSAIFIPILYFKIKKHKIIPINDPRLNESKKLGECNMSSSNMDYDKSEPKHVPIILSIILTIIVIFIITYAVIFYFKGSLTMQQNANEKEYGKAFDLQQLNKYEEDYLNQTK